MIFCLNASNYRILQGDQQYVDDYMSAVKDSIDMGRARMIDESEKELQEWVQDL